MASNYTWLTENAYICDAYETLAGQIMTNLSIIEALADPTKSPDERTNLIALDANPKQIWSWIIKGTDPIADRETLVQRIDAVRSALGFTAFTWPTGFNLLNQSRWMSAGDINTIARAVGFPVYPSTSLGLLERYNLYTSKTDPINVHKQYIKYDVSASQVTLASGKKRWNGEASSPSVDEDLPIGGNAISYQWAQMVTTAPTIYRFREYDPLLLLEADVYYASINDVGISWNSPNGADASTGHRCEYYDKHNSPYLKYNATDSQFISHEPELLSRILFEQKSTSFINRVVNQYLTKSRYDLPWTRVDRVNLTDIESMAESGLKIYLCTMDYDSFDPAPGTGTPTGLVKTELGPEANTAIGVLSDLSTLTGDLLISVEISHDPTFNLATYHDVPSSRWANYFSDDEADIFDCLRIKEDNRKATFQINDIFLWEAARN